MAGEVDLQCSAHGPVATGQIVEGRGDWTEPHRRIAPGQSIVAYVDDLVVGGGMVGRTPAPGTDEMSRVSDTR